MIDDCEAVSVLLARTPTPRTYSPCLALRAEGNFVATANTPMDGHLHHHHRHELVWAAKSC